jgi:hypothetical protein
MEHTHFKFPDDGMFTFFFNHLDSSRGHQEAATVGHENGT